MSINAKSTVCAVIGHPIGHSLSPAMHNAAYKALGINWVYVAFDVTNIQEALIGMRGLGVRGLSVTIPHKLAVMEHLDEIEPIAEAVGAVNTVINEDGRLIGTNTDGYGAVASLRAVTDPEKQEVLMIGSGGAARGVAFALAKDCSCPCMNFVGRKEDREERDLLAKQVGEFAGIPTRTTHDLAEDITGGRLAELMESAGIVVHTTPVGMAPNVDGCLLPPEFWRKGQVAFDLVYNPFETKLLSGAREAGCITLNGLPMLAHQGAEQIRRWTSQNPSVEVMLDAAKAQMEEAS